MKYTKGPWKVYWNEELERSEIKAMKSNYTLLLVVEDIICNGLEEVKANAQLISKAPELLEMLQRLVDAMHVPVPDAIKTLQDAQNLILDAKGLK